MNKSLGDYAREVLDVNGDGKITVQDVIALFPSKAVMIAVLFVDLAVGIAEYRVFDVGWQITHDYLKALGFVLVSAVPFYLGQLFWLYPKANFLQRCIGILFAAGGLYASAEFGLADLSTQYDVDGIIKIVIYAGLTYIILALCYVLLDDEIKAHRAIAQMKGKTEKETKYQSLLREVMTEIQKTKKQEDELLADFNEPSSQLIIKEALAKLRGQNKIQYAAEDEQLKLKDKANPQKPER